MCRPFSKYVKEDRNEKTDIWFTSILTGNLFISVGLNIEVCLMKDLITI